jgi:putative membrane protein
LSATEAPEWRRTSPLAAVFYLGRIYQQIARNAVQSLAPLAAFLVAVRGDTGTKLAVGIGLFVLVTVVHAILRFWFFRYSVAAGSILIREGVFRRKQLDIKFERIQGIGVTQNLIFRLFGLVTVNFDTAGASGQEGSLPAIRRDFAEALRERVRHTTPGRERPPADGEAAADAGAGRENDARTLVRLRGGDIVRIGLSSSRVFLVLVLVGPIMEYVERAGEQWVEENELLRALGAVHVGSGVGIAVVLSIALAILLILLGASIAGALLRYHRYELAADDGVLRSAGGLLTRHEHSISRSKMQSLHVIQNFMLRRFRRYRLRARQATSGRGGTISRFDIPICNGNELADIGAEMFQRELNGLALDPEGAGFERISRYYLNSRILLFGVLPALTGLAVIWPIAGRPALLALLWVPLISAVAWRKYRRYGVAVSEHGMAFRRGLIGYRVVLWLHRKVQRVSVSQSPFQRRRGLATVRFYLAAGSVAVPFIDYAAAARLRDYVLYRVESSRRAWH